MTTRDTNPIKCQEKWKKLRFWKKWSSKWDWNILSTPPAILRYYKSQISWSYDKNFVRGRSLKKVSAQNMTFCQNIPTPFWASFFQNLNFFHFSCHITWLVCREVTISLLGWSSRSDGPFRHLEKVLKVHRKLFWCLWKKVSIRNTTFLSFLPHSFFELTLFSRTSKTFSLEFKDFFEFRVCERSVWPRYLSQKRNRDCTTHQSGYMSEKVEKS